MMMILFVCLLFFFLSFVNASLLNVHIVPHSHDDVGWIKTADGYYSPTVANIYTTVTTQLALNSNRTFQAVEIYFFKRWYDSQSLVTQNLTQRLVASKQLTFMTAGWVQTDEGCVYYGDTINQMELGHRFLMNTFGIFPTSSSQIDPFGHSATHANLLSEMGFNSMFAARVEYQYYNALVANKSLEILWQPSPSLGTSIYIDVFYNKNYSPPPGFCMDGTAGCNDAAFSSSCDQARINTFLSLVRAQANVTLGNDVALQFGNDFTYSNAASWYASIDHLINCINSNATWNSSYYLFYSNFDIYTNAKFLAVNSSLSFPLKKDDDFFPFSVYSGNPNQISSYWGGYFTSRPALKRYVRMNSAFLSVIRQFEVFTSGNGSASYPVVNAVSILQHHDAITGTSKQNVAYDYAKILSDGRPLAAAFISNALGGGGFKECKLINISICVSTTDSVIVVLYNPLARNRTELISIPILSPNTSVVDVSSGLIIPSLVVSVIPNAASNNISSNWTIEFSVSIPGLGYITVQLVQTATPNISLPQQQGATSIENQYIRLNFNKSGIISFVDKQTNTTTSFQQQIMMYNVWGPGAYKFVSLDLAPTSLLDINSFLTFLSDTSVYQYVNPWVSQIISLEDAVVRFKWTVGPLPNDAKSREIINRFITPGGGTDKSTVWFTDSNGREFIRRQYNHRASFNWVVEGTGKSYVTFNWYPVNAAIKTAASNSTTMTVLVDRSQAGSSAAKGVIDLLIHRREFADDFYGVNEPLNETTDGVSVANCPGSIFPCRYGNGLVVTGDHFLVLSQNNVTHSVIRPLQERLYHPVHVLISLSSVPNITTSSWIKNNLPANIELENIQIYSDGNVSLRLAHSFAVGEDSAFSLPTSVDMGQIFTKTIVSVIETSLTGNRLKSDMPIQTYTTPRYGSLVGTVVTLGPMEIKAFNVTFGTPPLPLVLSSYSSTGISQSSSSSSSSSLDPISLSASESSSSSSSSVSFNLSSSSSSITVISSSSSSSPSVFNISSSSFSSSIANQTCSCVCV